MLYKLELLRKSVEGAIRAQHVRILDELGDVPHETYLDMAQMLGRVEMAADGAIKAHEQRVKSTDATSEGERRKREKLIHDLRGRIQATNVEIDRTKSRAEGDRERAHRALSSKKRAEVLELQWMGKAVKSESLRQRERVLQKEYRAVDIEAIDSLQKQVDELKRDAADYTDFLAVGASGGDGYLDVIPSFDDTINSDPATPDEHFFYVELCASVDYVLSMLTPKEEAVLRWRFGIGKARDHTLEEVAAELGGTRERIRQIEGKALRRLRNFTRIKWLRDFEGELLPHWFDMGAGRHRWGEISRQTVDKAQPKKRKRRKKRSGS